MTDTQRLQAIENQLRDVQAQLAQLSLAVAECSRCSDRRRHATQAAVDGLAGSIEQIFNNVRVPGIDFTPGFRYIID